MSGAALDERALRKAWLKQHFASWEYHEEMLRMHHGVMEVTLRALRRAEADTSTPASQGSGFANVSEEAKHFRQRYLPLMMRNEDLGKYKKEDWPRARASATFRSIPDYHRYMADGGGAGAFSWMTHEELVEQGRFWGPMDQMAQNIQYTVDGSWYSKLRQHDDDLLNIEVTGEIKLPSDWRQQVLGSASPLLELDAPRVRAGDPVPQGGIWQALDPRAPTTRVQPGDVLPNLPSAYGLTIWQRVGE